MSDLIGRTLGSYRILSQIGRGGMATVYKAYQPSLDRHVAIKVLPAYFAEQDETFLKRFKQEARSIAKLRHPNILVVHEYGEEQGTTYIVMEYVEAGTLTERLRDPMTLAEVEPLLRQVAAALDYAHEEKVIHRDVKPSNILLKSPDWPLLTDFGLAKIVGGTHLTQTGAIFGTPAYMSPEQGRGEQLDGRSDIYSLGIILYEMVTGAVPYTAETPMAVVVKHIIDPLPLPHTKKPDIPEAVELVILKALAKDPADRYGRAGEMAQALTEAVGRAVARVSAPAAPIAPQAGAPEAATIPPPARRPVPWVLGGIGALLLVCVAALALARGGLSAVRSAANQSAQATRTIDQLMADAVARLDQGDLAEATADFQAAADLEPSNLDLLWEVASVLEDYGYPEEAAVFVGRALASAPDDPAVYEAAAWQYYDLGFYPEAVAQFERMLELDPQAVWPLIWQAQAYQAMGDPRSAMAVLDTAMARPQVDDPSLYENIGWAYSAVEAWGQAKVAFRQAVGSDSADTAAWTGLADATYYADGVGAALAILQEALTKNPADPSLYEKAGWYAWELGDTLGAEGSFLQALEIDSSYTSSYSSLAGLYSELDRADEAIAILQRGTAANPSDPWLKESLGKVFLDEGEAQLAFEQFAAALELEPGGAWLALEAATAYYRYRGDPAGSADYLEMAAEIGPDDQYLLEAIGLLYEEMGDCERAAEIFRRTLEIDARLEGAQAGLGRCIG